MEWPKTTDTSCWYCTYPFDTSPTCVPNKYDDMRKVFYVTGVFCTWGCAKKYNMERNSVYKHVSSTLLSLLRHRILGQSKCNDASQYSIVCAPSRYKLKRFGGTMTIEEFREGLQALKYDDAVGNVKVADGEIKEVDSRGESSNTSVSTLWTSPNVVPELKFSQVLLDVENVDDDNPNPPVVVSRSNKSANRDASMIDSIVNAPSVKNQPYKLKRSKPVGNIGNTLFQSMNLRIEKAD